MAQPPPPPPITQGVGGGVVQTILSQYYNADVYQAIPKTFKAQFMKKLSNTEAELKKSIAYIKKTVCGI